MAFLLLWLLAAMPGLLFASGILCSILLIWFQPSGAVPASLLATAVAAAFWVWILPSVLYRRLLASLPLVEDEALGRSWARAFDGMPDPGVEPGLRLIQEATPFLLVLKAPFRPPLLVVSSGWLFVFGEDAFRAACRRSVTRMQSDGLELWTCGAVLVRALQVGLSSAFASLVLSPASERSGRLRLSPWRMALSLPVLAWIAWIRAVLRLEPLPASHGPGESASVDWPGRGAPGFAVLHQLLSLDAIPADRHGQRSILSWIPGHW